MPEAAAAGVGVGCAVVAGGGGEGDVGTVEGGDVTAVALEGAGVGGVGRDGRVAAVADGVSAVAAAGVGDVAGEAAVEGAGPDGAAGCEAAVAGAGVGAGVGAGGAETVVDGVAGDGGWAGETPRNLPMRSSTALRSDCVCARFKISRKDWLLSLVACASAGDNAANRNAAAVTMVLTCMMCIPASRRKEYVQL